MAASQNEDVEEPWVTYLHLWTALLLPNKQDPATPSRRHSTAPKLGLHTSNEPDQLALQQQAVYDALMQAIMDAVKNLDLEYHQAQGSGARDAAAKLTSPDSKAGMGQVCPATSPASARCRPCLLDASGYFDNCCRHESGG